MLVLETTAILAQSPQNAGEPVKLSLNLHITSNKPVYRVGEPILITIMLRNEGNEVVWLNPPGYFGKWPGDYYVEVVGPDGKVLLTRIPVAGGVPATQLRDERDVLQDFLRHHIPFHTGAFWGITSNIEDAGVSPRAPGRYKVTATFYVGPIGDYSEESLRKLKAELISPIHTEPIVSEPITIEIRSDESRQ